MKTLIGICIFVLSVSAMAQNKPPAPSSKNNSCLVQCPQGPKGPKGDKGDSASASIYFKVVSYFNLGRTIHDGQREVATHFICWRASRLCLWAGYDPPSDLLACNNPLDVDLGTHYYNADSRPLEELHLITTQEETERMLAHPDIAGIHRGDRISGSLMRVPVVGVRTCGNTHEQLAPALE